MTTVYSHSGKKKRWPYYISNENFEYQLLLRLNEKYRVSAVESSASFIDCLLLKD